MNPQEGSSQKPAENKDPNSEVIEFSDHPTFNFSLAISYLVALVAILGAVLFWWLNNDSVASLTAKNSEKSSIISEITSPTNIDVEKKASDFKSSVSALKSAEANKFEYSPFLTNLYTKITNDVTISGLSITSEGTVNLTGTAPTYRSVADLMMALKSWDTLSNVDLGSVSMTTVENEAPHAVFAVSAKLVKKAKISTTATSGGVSIETTEGGNL